VTNYGKLAAGETTEYEDERSRGRAPMRSPVVEGVEDEVVSAKTEATAPARVWKSGERALHNSQEVTVVSALGADELLVRVLSDGVLHRVQPSSCRAAPKAKKPKLTGPPKPKLAPELLTTESLLRDVHEFLTDFVVFASSHEAVAVTLWVLHTYVVNEFDSTPRLVIRAPQRQSGKTRLIECLRVLCHNPTMTTGITVSAMFRSIESAQPTLLIDESDTIFGPGASSDHRDLVGAIDTGHRKGAVYIRCVGQDLVPTKFKVYCPVALAGIGNPPDQILDRSIIVNMRRKGSGEKVKPFRLTPAEKRGLSITQRLLLWAGTVRGKIPEPTMPDGVDDRPADVWHALLAIGDLGGEEWATQARTACATMVGAWAVEGGDDQGLQLLNDLRGIFGDDDRKATHALLLALMALPESPWKDIGYGQGLTDVTLARILKPYGIKPISYRNGERTERGYLRGMFTDSWDRYLTHTSESAKTL